MPYRLLILITIAAYSTPQSVWAAEKVTYADDVRPVLREHCFACHNQDDATASLALDSFEGILAGGASGDVVAAGNLSGSRLWKLVSHQEEPKMPPGKKLGETQLQILHNWIKGGLLNTADSQRIISTKPTIQKIDASKLGKSTSEPAMPEQLFHEPMLWTSQVGPIDALATSPWAPLAAIAWQRQISFYNTDTHKLLGILPYIDGVPKVVRFSRDGSLLLVAGGKHAVSGSVTLFDIKTGARLTTLGDELDIVLAADISPDLSLVAIGGPKKKVRVFEVSTGERVYQIDKHTDWITALGFSPDGRLLATADRNGDALLWQASAGHERADLRGHKSTITSLDWRADSAMLATASEDGTVRLWNTSGKSMQSITAHKPGVLSVRFHRNGDWVTAGRDRKIRTWKLDGSPIADLGKFPGMTMAAVFTHDGQKIVASDYFGKVRSIEAVNKKKRTNLRPNPLPLARRLAKAEKSLQLAQREIKKLEKQLKSDILAHAEGQTAHTAHENKTAAAQNTLTDAQKLYEQLDETQDNYADKAADAEKNIQAAEAVLARVTNETAGLTDLDKLTEQIELTKSSLQKSRRQFKRSQRTKSFLVTQQKRFSEASQTLAEQAQTHQKSLQKLAKQSGRLEAEHQQAIKEITSHKNKLTELTQQMQALQKQLAQLQDSQTKFQQQEGKLALALKKVQNKLSNSQQAVELLKNLQQDFTAAQALRDRYLQKTTASKE